jgi:membrane protease YdiL (CAAX protease family)
LLIAIGESVSTQQQDSSRAKAIVLVLLLYVFGTFVSGMLSHQGFSATWSELGFRGVLVLFGAVLFCSSDRVNESKTIPLRSRDFVFAGCLALGLVAAGISGALGMAANDPDLRSGDLPPASVLIIQLILGAAGEELVFVGFLYRSFRGKTSVVNATAVAGFLFVLLHWPSSTMGVLARAVYILASCSLFERCRTISLNIGLHILVNGAFLVTVLLANDHVPFTPFFASFGLIAAVALSAFVAFAAVCYGWQWQAARWPWIKTAPPPSDTRSSS